jgi:hypothetical protein
MDSAATAPVAAGKGQARQHVARRQAARAPVHQVCEELWDPRRGELPPMRCRSALRFLRRQGNDQGSMRAGSRGPLGRGRNQIRSLIAARHGCQVFNNRRREPILHRSQNDLIQLTRLVIASPPPTNASRDRCSDLGRGRGIKLPAERQARRPSSADAGGHLNIARIMRCERQRARTVGCRPTAHNALSVMFKCPPLRCAALINATVHNVRTTQPEAPVLITVTWQWQLCRYSLPQTSVVAVHALRTSLDICRCATGGKCNFYGICIASINSVQAKATSPRTFDRRTHGVQNQP